MRVGDCVAIKFMTYRGIQSNDGPLNKAPEIITHAQPFALKAWKPFGIEPTKSQ